jgi:hypothetical protein
MDQSKEIQPQKGAKKRKNLKRLKKKPTPSSIFWALLEPFCG